jgi:hypothetical protein
MVTKVAVVNKIAWGFKNQSRVQKGEMDLQKGEMDLHVVFTTVARF